MKDKYKRKDKGRRFCLGGGGGGCIQFLAAICFAQDDYEEQDEFFLFSNHPGAIHPIIQNRPWLNSQHGKELIKFFPQTEVTAFAFSSVFILILWLP